MKKNKKEEVQELISAYVFAERKGVTPHMIYINMEPKEDGTPAKIEYTVIGKQKYIDWNKFKHINFPNAGKRGGKMI